jgi:hypothetical protein
MLTHPALRGPSYTEAVMSTKPVRYYRANETSGTLLRDYTGTNDMTIQGTPTKRGSLNPPGVPDGAGFETTSGSGGFAIGNSTAPPASAYTFAAWSYGGSVGDRGIFGIWQSSIGALIYRSSATKLAFIHRGTNLVSNGTEDGNWHFVVGTWDGANVRLYVDGVLRGGPSANATAPGASGAWAMNTYYVSGSGATRITTGITAEAVVWDRALSLAEINHFAALGYGR